MKKLLTAASLVVLMSLPSMAQEPPKDSAAPAAQPSPPTPPAAQPAPPAAQPETAPPAAQPEAPVAPAPQAAAPSDKMAGEKTAAASSYAGAISAKELFSQSIKDSA